MALQRSMRWSVVLAGLGLVQCSGEDEGTSDKGASGGAAGTSSGGAAGSSGGTGGATSTGGAAGSSGGTGGATSTGGTSGAAGSTTTGGAAGSTGGAGGSNTGGAAGSTGGAGGSSTGGAAGSTGGSGGVAGTAGSGGAGGAGGSGAVGGAWPGTAPVVTVDGNGVFGGNLSGLTYQPGTPSVLWAVRNGPSTLYRLIWNGTTYSRDAANGWGSGKNLRYPAGTGSPDSEGVTFAEWSTPLAYVATERDGGGASKLSVLAYDVTGTAATLNAAHEWDLTADLPATGANLGLEAITWIPDSFLVARGFYDEHLAHAYAPADYPAHGTGLFVVGVEGGGMLHAYALDAGGGTYQRVASFTSGHGAVMGLEFDRDSGYLWASCDNSCGNQAAVLTIDQAATSPTFGRFVVHTTFARPSDLADLNNEGIAVAPDAECAGGQKAWFWADDGETAGHSVRRASIPCGAWLP